ncbi:MAG: C-GCAxxG-C-C family protein [Bacteroidales bacterium]
MNKFIDDKSLGDKAIALFNDSFNCSQSVISVYADYIGVDKNLVLNISCGFGGGMGSLQRTCGAVTAAYMVFGLLNSSECHDNQVKKAKTYMMIQSFYDSFTKIHGTTDCIDLIKCDLKTEKGQTYFKNENLKKSVCEGCIRESVKLINKTISENPGILYQRG